MNVKNLVLGIGIVVVFALVLWQGIETFYPSPQYDSYCNVTARGAEQIYNSSYCEAVGGQWNEDAYPRPTIDNKTVTGYCDLYYSCNNNYNDAMTSHSWRVFIISLVVGIILLLVGLIFPVPEPLGSSFIGCAVWAIFWGSVINWRNFGSAWRFILLLIALGLLVGITIKINKNRKE